MNVGLVYILSAIALVVSAYLAVTMFIELAAMSRMIVGVVVLVTAFYFVGRVQYVKSKGGDLLQELRAPYPDWEAREAACKE